MKRLLLLTLLLLAICTPAFSAPAGSHSRVDPVKVRRELRQILAAREYNQSTEKSGFEKWLERAGNILKNSLKSLFAWVARHLTIKESPGAGIVTFVGAWLVVIGFLVLVGLVISKLIGGTGRRARKDPVSGNMSYGIPTAKAMTGQAARLAEAGDYKGAFKSAYLASIAYLDEIRALRFERSRTNWEYLRELKSGGHEKPHAELFPLTVEFDRKIYGRESCGKDDYLNATAVYERLSSEEAK